MFFIRSTYAEYSPEYDDFPTGRQWPGPYAVYASAWGAVNRYLFASCAWHLLNNDGIASYGQTQATAHYGEMIIVNDQETITISQDVAQN